MRAPLRGFEAECFCLMYMRPGISCSAISISLRPKAAREISADRSRGDEEELITNGCGGETAYQRLYRP